MTAPNATSPRKYLGAITKLGAANVANSKALAKRRASREAAIRARVAAATRRKLAIAFRNSRAPPRQNAMLSAWSRMRSSSERKCASDSAHAASASVRGPANRSDARNAPNAPYRKLVKTSAGDIEYSTRVNAHSDRSFCATVVRSDAHVSVNRRVSSHRECSGFGGAELRALGARFLDSRDPNVFLDSPRSSR